MEPGHEIPPGGSIIVQLDGEVVNRGIGEVLEWYREFCKCVYSICSFCGNEFIFFISFSNRTMVQGRLRTIIED